MLHPPVPTQRVEEGTHPHRYPVALPDLVETLARNVKSHPPDYVTKESCLNLGASLGVQGLLYPRGRNSRELGSVHSVC